MEFLAKGRKKLGLSQEEMARELEVERSTYASYESGRRPLPLDVLARFKRASRMSWNQIGKWLERLYP